MKTSKKRRYEEIDDEENDDFEPTPSKKYFIRDLSV